MVNLFFAKEFTKDEINLPEDLFCCEAQSFIKIEKRDLNNIQMQNQLKNSPSIISSQNVLFATEIMQREPSVFTVGEKSADFLKEDNRYVEFVANDSKELTEVLIHSSYQSFNYFCGNKRLDYLPENIRSAGKICNEIICYETKENRSKLDKSFDGYSFFSPSGVDVFFRDNDLPESATIFAFGNSTKKTLENYSVKDIILPSKPQLTFLIQTIKEYYV